MTVETFQALSVGSALEADVSLVSSPQSSRELNLQIWTTVTTAVAPERPRGESTLIVFPGLRRALSVRVYRTDGDTAVEDPATGVFGAGDDLPTAVQDFQDALQDHLTVLAGEDALALPLQRQLEILRSYFNTP
jgi:hypothetical protein